MDRGIIEWDHTDFDEGVGEARVSSNELIDEETVTQFRDELIELAMSGVSDLELDMSQVHMVSSMAICAVITIDRKLQERGGRLRLRNVHAFALEVFSYMRLHELLDIEAIEDAIAA